MKKIIVFFIAAFVMQNAWSWTCSSSSGTAYSTDCGTTQYCTRGNSTASCTNCSNQKPTGVSYSTSASYPSGPSCRWTLFCSGGLFYTGGTNGTCDHCAAGTYRSTASNITNTINNATVCSSCSGGYYCNEGSSTATQHICPAGSYCPAGTGTPLPCPKGYYCIAGQSSGTTHSQIGAWHNIINLRRR
jgi:hypothetical protein